MHRFHGPRRIPKLPRRAFGAGAIALGAGACGGSSGGKRVALTTELELAPGAGEPFTFASGTRVTVTSARVALGALYYFDGPPAVASDRPRSPFQRLARWLSIPEAHAHPGHYHTGDALGQMLEAAEVDVLAAAGAPLPLGAGGGVTGTYRSGTFVFGARGGDALGDSVVQLEASAETDGEERALRFAGTFADVAQNAAEGGVAGCVFEETDVDRAGTVIVTLDPRVWLRFADPSAYEGEADVARDSTLFAAFALGLAQLDAYRFRFVPGEQ